MKKINQLCALGASLILVSCGSLTTSVSGTDTLTLPSSVAINVDDVSSSSSSNLSTTKALGGGTYAAPIQAGANIMGAINIVTSAMLSAMDNLSITSSTTTTTFETTVTGVGTFKIDFATLASIAFDQDGDGTDTTQTCSGNSATLPVCALIWLDNAQLAVLVITTEPTSTDSGAGYILMKPNTINSSSASDLMISVAWDFTDSANKVANGFVKGTVEASTNITVGHIFGSEVTQSNGDVLIQVRESETSGTHPAGWTSLQFAIQWVNGQDFASFKHVGVGGANAQDTSAAPICVKISTAAEASSTASCASVGNGTDVQVDSVSFFAVPTDTTVVDFPSAFTSTPTF